MFQINIMAVTLDEQKRLLGPTKNQEPVVLSASSDGDLWDGLQ